MARVGRNPARIIPVWHEFITGHPGSAQEGGRGMWMVNQLCDLLQLRTHPWGSVVRVRMGRS